MRSVFFSLRTKLFVLIILSLGVVVAPLILFTNQEVARTIQAMEKASLANVLNLVVDNISTKYLNMFTDKVVRVMAERDRLRRTAELARNLWQVLDKSGGQEAPAGGYGRAGGPDAFRGRRGLYMALFRELFESAGALQLYDARARPVAGLGWSAKPLSLAGAVDFKGRPLERLIASRALSPAGEYAVFARKDEGGSGEAVLAFFLPLPEKSMVLAAFVGLADIEREAASSLDSLIATTRERLETLHFYAHGFIAVYRGDGTPVIHRGNPAWTDAALLPAAGLDLARRHGSAVLEAPPPENAPEALRLQGDMAFHMAYFKSLDWYIVAAAPKMEVDAPSIRLVQRQIAISAGAALVILAATLIMAAKLVRPLLLLSQKAQALPRMDLTAADADALFAEGLPTERADEVGGLARSFSLMGQTLARNIRELMETTAAKERMQGELNAARDIQMGILPPPHTAREVADGVALAAMLEPAKEVGGDFYDFFPAPDGRLCLVIGDVSGKGVPAALFMSMTVTLVRYTMAGGLNPAAAMRCVNAALSANNPASMFVTLFIGLFNPADGVLEYSNGGHCRPLVWGKGSFREVKEMSGPLVGVMENASFALRRTRVEAGESCLLFTDGVTEAMNKTGELFGVERLAAICEDREAGSRVELDGLLAAIREAAAAFGEDEPQTDDITMLCFTSRPSPPSSDGWVPT